MSREIVLAARPAGEPRETDFELRDAHDREPADGEVAVRNVFVSVDPYMRGRMTGVRTYVSGFEVGDVVDGAPSGASSPRGTPALPRATGCCRGSAGASTESPTATSCASSTRRLAPPSTSLGVLGMPGLTAWVGLVDIGRVKEGETVWVSGAAGAVGSIAAQIAKLRGCA